MALTQVAQRSAIYGPCMHAMMHWLAEAARELREGQDRKQVHVAASANLDQSTVNRFERGESQPADVDRMVAAYADDLDITPFTIWSRALELWREDGASATARAGNARQAPPGELGRRASDSAPKPRGRRRAAS